MDPRFDGMTKAAPFINRRSPAADHLPCPARRESGGAFARADGGVSEDLRVPRCVSRASLWGGLSLATLAALLCGTAAADGLWPDHAAAVTGPGHDLLKVDQAFKLVAAAREHDALTVSWDIAPGYYLYRKRLRFEAVTPQGAKLEAAQLPKGEMVDDAHEGHAEIYRGALQAALHWRKHAPPPQQLRVSYQGCAEAGVCYPPQSRLVDVIDLSR
jgi:thiol:disulfide interchange protein